MLYMRQANVRELQHHLSRVMRWVDLGEQVRITRRNRVVARLVPDTQPPKQIQWPDFVARAKKTFKKTKGKPLSQIVMESRSQRF